MDIILEQYQARMHRLRRAKGTIVCFSNAARRYQEWLDTNGLTALDAEGHQIEEFFLGMDDLAPGTVQLYLNEIKAAYRYARATKLMTHDPTVDVRLPRQPDREPTIIPNPELREIKDRCVKDREWLTFHLLAYTGLRRMEVLGLRSDDVSLPDATMTVTGKGSKIRYVPIHPALAEVLPDLEPGRHVVGGRTKPISDNTMEADLARIAPGRTSHAFRRTVATSLARNSVDERVIDKILGWSPRTVRARYYVNVATDEMRRGILKLYANDPV